MVCLIDGKYRAAPLPLKDSGKILPIYEAAVRDEGSSILWLNPLNDRTLPWIKS